MFIYIYIYIYQLLSLCSFAIHYSYYKYINFNTNHYYTPIHIQYKQFIYNTNNSFTIQTTHLQYINFNTNHYYTPAKAGCPRRRGARAGLTAAPCIR